MFKNLTDEELSNKIKNKENILECIEELRNRHSGIFFQKANRYSGIMEVRDLKENNVSFFYEVAKEYDSSKSKFPTFLGNKTFYICQDLLKKHKNFSEITDYSASEMPHLGRKEVYKYVLDSIEDEESRDIVKKHLEGMTFREISESIGGKYCSEWVRKKFNREIDRFKLILKDEL